MTKKKKNTLVISEILDCTFDYDTSKHRLNVGFLKIFFAPESEACVQVRSKELIRCGGSCKKYEWKIRYNIHQQKGQRCSVPHNSSVFFMGMQQYSV